MVIPHIRNGKNFYFFCDWPFCKKNDRKIANYLKTILLYVHRLNVLHTKKVLNYVVQVFMKLCQTFKNEAFANIAMDINT